MVPDLIVTDIQERKSTRNREDGRGGRGSVNGSTKEIRMRLPRYYIEPLGISDLHINITPIKVQNYKPNADIFYRVLYI